ncbi:M28 family peptidase [Marinilongibacter aquaticus]|uniref:M28 family peptidase n=1 Tax=Marinilongibacter aquaticus TaxID=2975157 RepID=UPI0021BD70E5|nr:M28 family peptidase [Marinilongibacter aquaticus]UBM60697.1 M28 family peptidase [Marinilongibacter aquaticus]
MIKGLYWINLFVLLLLSSFIHIQTDPQSVFAAIASNVDKKGMAYENLQAASVEIGHRLTGSENGKKAEQMAYDLFEKYGLKNTQFIPFEVSSWSREQVSLKIVPDQSDNFRDVEVVSLAHSPIAANVSGKIIDCKDGLESDFEDVGDSLSGNIALFNVDVRYDKNKGKPNLHRSEKTALAIKNGAAAVILVNRVKGGVLLTGTASVTGDLIAIPAVCVSLESGRAIRKWIRDEKNIMAQIDMTNHFEPVRARNVAAKYNGKLKKETIVVGAHLDSWDLAQGAIDNGLGAFSVIDIARVFKDLKLKTKRPIQFVLFMGEEEGLLGSKAYLDYLKKTGDIENVAMMVNLDMVNDCSGFNAFGDEKMKSLVEKYGKEIQDFDPNYKNKNYNSAGLHSDHQVFMTAGVPICTPTGHLSPSAINCYHADCDKIDLVNKSEINNNVKYTAMMLYELANSHKLPAKKNSEETRDYLIAQHLKEALILGKEWLWEE